MGKIIYSGIGITVISGKSGTQVHARNTSGYYIRDNVPPGNPNTSYQQQAREYLTNVTQRWANLSEEQQTEWHKAAESGYWNQKDRLGQSYQPTGQQLFIRQNITVAPYSVQFDSPPTKRSVTVPEPFTLEILESTGNYNFKINFEINSITPDTLARLWATKALSTGTWRPRASHYKLIETLPADTFQGSNDLYPAWTSRFDTFPGAGRIFVYLDVLDLTSGEITVGGKAMDTYP
jgi:hypothetical protein